MDEVIIVEYDPHWPTLFAAEAARIQKVLGNDQVVIIEHIGSTAVPKIAAKPIIDLMVGVYSLQKAQRAIPLLEGLGYVYWREDPRPGRMFFVQGMPPYGLQRTHHLHIVEAYKEFGEERLLFRNYLRAHPYEAERYQALKLDLAGRFRTDREAYTDGKSKYVQAIVDKALRRQTLKN